MVKLSKNSFFMVINVVMVIVMVIFMVIFMKFSWSSSWFSTIIVLLHVISIHIIIIFMAIVIFNPRPSHGALALVNISPLISGSKHSPPPWGNLSVWNFQIRPIEVS